MKRTITGILKGILEGCVLELISRGETYGYDITHTLDKKVFGDIANGTVYAILQRLEESKLVESRVRVSGAGPSRKFYTITDAGRQELKYFWMRWDFVTQKMGELRRGGAACPGN